MKRLIYLTYLGLLVLILISCQKENVMPVAAAEETQQADLKSAPCQPYFFFTKTGIQNYGNLRSDYITVSFENHVSAVQQEALLSRFPIFDKLDGSTPHMSGDLTFVMLDPTTNCFEVERMLKNLEKSPAVKFACPVFNDPTGVGPYVALNDEFLVVLKDPGYYRHLAHLAKITKTSIIDNWDDVTFVLSADKNSRGNALEMSSTFNASHFIDNAEPLVIGVLPGNNNAPIKVIPQKASMKAAPNLALTH